MLKLLNWIELKSLDQNKEDTTTNKAEELCLLPKLKGGNVKNKRNKT